MSDHLTKAEVKDLTERVNDRLSEFGDDQLSQLEPGYVRLVYDEIQAWECDRPAPADEAESDTYMLGWSKGYDQARAQLAQIFDERLIAFFNSVTDHEGDRNGHPRFEAILMDAAVEHLTGQAAANGLTTTEQRQDAVADAIAQSDPAVGLGQQPAPEFLASFPQTPEQVIDEMREAMAVNPARRQEIAEMLNGADADDAPDDLTKPVDSQWPKLDNLPDGADPFPEHPVTGAPAEDDDLIDSIPTPLEGLEIAPPAVHDPITVVGEKVLPNGATVRATATSSFAPAAPQKRVEKSTEASAPTVATTADAYDAQAANDLVMMAVDTDKFHRMLAQANAITLRRVLQRLSAAQVNKRTIIEQALAAKVMAPTAPPKVDEKLTEAAPVAEPPATVAEDAASEDGEDDEDAALKMGADQKAAELRNLLIELQVMSDDGRTMPTMDEWDKKRPKGMVKAQAYLKRHGVTWGELAIRARLKMKRGA